VSFHEVQFPVDIPYGLTGGPGSRTDIIETDSGQEQRVSYWSESRKRYNVAYTIRSLDQLSTLISFYHARRGPAFGFRFKDFQDFTSAANHRAAPTNMDQIIGTGNAATTQFQLIKNYTSGGITRSKKVTKPVANTVTISFDGVNQASGWTVNTATGIVTFTSAPGNGVIIRAGFEYDVPVRFGAELDEAMYVWYENFSSGSVPNIPLVELLDEAPISEEFYFGGARAVTFGADMTLVELNGRVQTLTPTANNLNVFLPSALVLPKGGPYFYVFNTHATFTINLRNNSGTLIGVVPALGFLTLVLGTDAVSAAIWYAF
jgi:uncharacterized protein (TIGR02217 family)